jgi:hypothetical protein
MQRRIIKGLHCGRLSAEPTVADSGRGASRTFFSFGKIAYSKQARTPTQLLGLKARAHYQPASHSVVAGLHELVDKPPALSEPWRCNLFVARLGAEQDLALRAFHGMGKGGQRGGLPVSRAAIRPQP